ncbi:glycosyltransferase [Paenibacillus cellulositrophicus]|uniref:glycosyltransferase n=1 Tax=Paenibacillus cellulositrophicus TaxID=562959 RepID=UPI003F7D69BE
MKVVFIGPLPPPRGGVSVHLSRLSAVMEQQGIDYEIYNEVKGAARSPHVHPLNRYRRFLFKIPFLKGDILHFHTIDPRLRSLLGLYKRLGQKIILTVHGVNLEDQIRHAGPLRRRILLRSLKSIDLIICVNEDTTRFLHELGFRHDRVVTIPAYIHPLERAEEARAIPAGVYTFMEEADFAICANGYVRFYRGEDLYGFDLLIQLMKELRGRGRRIRLLIAVMGVSAQTGEERSHYMRLQRELDAYGLSSDVMFYEVEDTEFYPILKKSHLFIRTTNTDGYGMSIAESLHGRIPCAASDVCRRPEGTVLFRSRDLADLAAKVSDIIDRYPHYKDQLQNLQVGDYAAELIQVYSSIAGKESPSGKPAVEVYGK